jgi:hypothetical protein
MPNPLSKSRPAEPEPSGEGTANRNLIGQLSRSATGAGASDGTAMFRRKKPEGRKSRESLMEARSEPTGAARPRPEPRWGPAEAAMRRWATREGSVRRPQGSGRSRSARRKKALPSPAWRTTAGKWGRWRHRPHYFLGLGFGESPATASRSGSAMLAERTAAALLAFVAGRAGAGIARPAPRRPLPRPRHRRSAARPHRQARYRSFQAGDRGMKWGPVSPPAPTGLSAGAWL